VQFKPLLADWIEVAIFAFIIISSLLGQLYKAAQENRKRAQKKAGQPPPMAGGGAPGQPVANAGRPKSLEKEIESFLRKQLGGPEPAEPKPPPRPPIGTARKPSRQTPPQPRPVARTSQRSTRTAFPERESVSSHVERHILSDGIGQRDSHLGEKLSHADERMESHLQEVFQHRLGTLDTEGGSSSSSIRQGTDAAVWSGGQVSTPLSVELFKMLSSPPQVQAAIVLSEILRRPEDRWS